MSRPEDLSGREYRALNYMNRYLEEWDNMPTCKEIIDELELTSTASGFNIINRLCEKDYLEKFSDGKYRFKRK